MSEIDLKEGGYRGSGNAEFTITVRDEAQILRERFMEREPAGKQNSGICAGAFQRTVHVVYRELMEHEEIGYEQSVIRSPRSANSCTNERRSFRRQRVQGLLAAFARAKKKPPQETCPREREEPRIHAGS